MGHSVNALKCARIVADEMRKLAHQFCVPIVAIQKGRKPDQCGTGTLFQVGERCSLVSAAHIVHDAQKGKAALYSSCANHSPLIPLEQPPFFTNKDWSRSSDESGPFDIAIWPLMSKQVSQFLVKKRFANNSVVTYCSDMSDIASHELFYFCGYPNDLADRNPNDVHNLIIKPIRWVAGQYLDRSKWPNLCETKYHLVFNANTAIAVDSDGAPGAPPPRPIGISGCAVWSLGWDFQRDSWNPGNARIIGIETRVFSRERLIRATGWVGVRSILMNQFPESDRAFSVHI